MDKKIFWKGYFFGILIPIGYVIFTFFYTPDVELNNIKLQDLKENTISTEQLLDGKPLVVNFWATWCGPCVAEFPSFEEMNQKYNSKVNFIMISDEEISKIEKFKNKKKYNLNIVKSTKTISEYGLNSIPVTYFFDKNGNLVATKTGGIELNELETEIKKLLE